MNIDPANACELNIDLRGKAARTVSGRILTASELNAHNTFDAPEQVKPVVFNTAKLKDNMLSLELPAKSIVVLELR